MSERYSHRNGETDAPTQAGWYWFDGDEQLHDGRWVVLGRQLCFWDRESPPYVVMVDADESFPVADMRELPPQVLRGHWYGPLRPPWAQPTSDTGCHQ